MLSYATLFTIMRAAALSATIHAARSQVLLAIGGRRCKENEFLHEIPDNIYYGESRYECRECGFRQYGTGGQCYNCPSFTRERKYKDFAGTLWCSNSCVEISQNANVKDVLITTNAEGAGAASVNVFQYQDGNAVCSICAGDKFAIHMNADVVLTHHQHDLLAMQFSRDEVDRLAAEKDRLQRFGWDICSSCPAGFVRGTWAVPAGSGIEEHVGKMIPCKACLVREGVPKSMACAKCGVDEWQQIAEVSIMPYKSAPAGWDGNRRNVLVGMECKKCPAGYQRVQTIDLQGEWSFGQCRGHTFSDCCSQCPVNKFKDSGDSCEFVSKNNVAIAGLNFVESAASGQRVCNPGERLAVCFHGSHCVYQITPSWKTCLPCSLDQTTRSSHTSGCPACRDEKKDLVDPTDSRKCTSCSMCTELTTDSIEEALQIHAGFYLIQNAYTVLKVLASCTPLQRRKLQKLDGQLRIDGTDHWRPEGQTRGVVLPAWQFLDRTQGTCVKKSCVDACPGRFQYSNGCGVDTAVALVWVRSPDGNLFQFGQLRAGDVSDASQWNVLTEGNCQFCTACNAGFYNNGCNKNYENAPAGACKPCMTQCPSKYFMLHPERDAGCHDPPLNHLAPDGSGKFQILDDYTCVACPTWVRLGEEISVVSACGLYKAGDTYEHYSSQMEGATIKKTLKPVQEEPHASSQIAGVERRNFRTFINNLQNYCPPRFFFNTRAPGCDFIDRGEEFELHSKVRVFMGYEAYAPQCCNQCTECAQFSATTKKDLSSWKECTGKTITDVQNKCVDKCVLGYWQDGDACRRCTTCYDGILADT